MSEGLESFGQKVNFYGINYDQLRGVGAYRSITSEAGSKYLVAEITPDDFLSLAANLPPGKSVDLGVQEFIDLFKSGGSIASPFLEFKFDKKSKTFEIVSHEGRHRALAIKKFDPSAKIPVIFANVDPMKKQDILKIVKYLNSEIKSQKKTAVKLSQPIDKIFLDGQIHTV